MPGSPKEKLRTETGSEEKTDEDQREVFLRDGRKLVVSEQGSEQLVEIRNPGGMVEVRIKLTEQGPVLQMEAARLQLKATEAVEIESQRVAIKGTEHLELAGKEVELTSEEDARVEAKGELVVRGKMIYLN
jgi:hypothetical protein